MSSIKTLMFTTFVRQELAAHGDFDAITFGILHFVDIKREVIALMMPSPKCSWITSFRGMP